MCMLHKHSLTPPANAGTIQLYALSECQQSACLNPTQYHFLGHPLQPPPLVVRGQPCNGITHPGCSGRARGPAPSYQKPLVHRTCKWRTPDTPGLHRMNVALVQAGFCKETLALASLPCSLLDSETAIQPTLGGKFSIGAKTTWMF